MNLSWLLAKVANQQLKLANWLGSSGDRCKDCPNLSLQTFAYSESKTVLGQGANKATKNSVVGTVRSDPTVTLKAIINKHALPCSTRTIQRYLKSIGYSYKKAQKVPYLDYRSHKARLTWALSYIDYTFSAAIFVDESQFLVGQPYNGWSQVGSPIHVQSRKFPPRVSVWASISCFGKLSLCFYEVTLNQLTYQSLLEQHFYPQADELWGKGVWVLMQGEATCHHAKSTVEAINRHSGSIIALPSGSPDLDTIEKNGWGILKDKVAAKNFETKEELQIVILENWSKLDNKRIASLACSMPHRAFKTIERGCSWVI